MLQEQIKALQEENAVLSEQLQDSKGIACSAIRELMELQKLRKEKEIMGRGALKIVGTADAVDADIVEEGMYLAGDKIYKWGEMLYLDD